MDRQNIKKKYYLPIIIVIVIVVSWLGVLDKYSDNYTNNAIIGAASTYAIARGINGVVSVLQTSTVHAGAGISGSIAFGEMLDPINDMIERFSDVMAWALGSLVLQKILLGISAHSIFKLLITALGFMLIVAFFVRNIAVMTMVTKIFALLIFIRFSLIIVVSLNSMVDSAFINKQITSGTGELSEFRNHIVQLKNQSGNLNIDMPAYEESIRDDRLKIADIETTILPGIEKELANEIIRLSKAEAVLEQIQNSIGWVNRLNPFEKDNAAIEAKQIITTHEVKIKNLESAIEKHKNLMEQLRDQIEDSEKRIAGEPVGIWERINNQLPSISGLKRSISFDMIGENVSGAVSNVIHLSVLFILKTIMIPIIFLLFFIKGIKKIWKTDLGRIINYEEKLATEPQ